MLLRKALFTNASGLPQRELTVRSKAQFEHRFDKWGFRKNLSKDEWGVVTYKIGKRKREHKDSEILLNELPMKTAKLEKAMSRYGPTSAMIFQGISPCPTVKWP